MWVLDRPSRKELCVKLGCYWFVEEIDGPNVYSTDQRDQFLVVQATPEEQRLLLKHGFLPSGGRAPRAKAPPRIRAVRG